MPIKTVYLAHAPLETVRDLVARTLTQGGWQVSTETVSPGECRLVAQRGNRLKTMFLGGGAGQDLYLRHVVTLSAQGADEQGRQITRISYPTSGGSSIVRGGPYGADREIRLHALASEQIASCLRDQGVVVGYA